MHVTSERMSQPSSGSNSRREGGGLNRHNEKNDMRQRRNDPNLAPRRDYNNPIGGRRVDNGVTDTATSHNRGHEHHRRKEIRHRVERKHQRVAPIWWTKFMHSETKNPVPGEFVGTTMFLFFAFAGTQDANAPTAQTTGNTSIAARGPNPATLLYISLSFGFSLMVNAWVFFRISGGLFNPAVTLALALLQSLTPIRAILIFIAQFTGACFAAYLVTVMFPTPFDVQTTLGGGTSLAQGLFIEVVCTAELVFTIVMLAMEKHKATYIAPVGIGLALFIGELLAVYYTGGSLNPARSFGPAAVSHTFNSDHWIYWLGPFLGSLLAAFFYWLFKVLEYEMANPGQDGDEENDPAQNPEHEIAQALDERQTEVEEIQNIEGNGGFGNSTDISATPSVLASEGVIGMTMDGVRAGDEMHVRRHRSREPDLEAQLSATGEIRNGVLHQKVSK